MSEKSDQVTPMKDVYNLDSGEEAYNYNLVEKTSEGVISYFRQPVVFKFLTQLKKFSPPQKVIDLGSGLSVETNFLQRVFPKFSVTSLDINHLGIKAGQDELGVGAVQADVLQLPFKSSSIAGLHSKDMFVHVADHDRFFQEVSRVLNVGGLFCLVSARAYGEMYLQFSWSPSKIKQLASKHNLKVIAEDTFKMEDDDWYEDERPVRKALLFQKEEKLSAELWRRLQQRFGK